MLAAAAGGRRIRVRGALDSLTRGPSGQSWGPAGSRAQWEESLVGMVDGKVVLVTGAASGIGRAAAELFAREGAEEVIAIDRDPAGGAETADLVRSFGGAITFHEADVTSRETLKEIISEEMERLGRLDAAFNNAGVTDESRSFTELTLEGWNRMIEINLTSVFLCMKFELEVMEHQGFGSIVNTSSGAGLTAAPGLPHYTAAKHGVLGLTKAAAAEYKNAGVRVNAILPGMTRTGMIEEWFGNSPEIAQAVANSLPGRRLGEPEQVASAALWLCSDHASWVSGASLVVDGGMINH